MIRVRITVLQPTATMEDDRGDDWGEWDFISLPRAGDHIDIERDGRPETLVVRRVVHFAAQNPLPRSETPYRQRKEPFIRLLAVREKSAVV
jgi:hypothetical protein